MRGTAIHIRVGLHLGGARLPVAFGSPTVSDRVAECQSYELVRHVGRSADVCHRQETTRLRPPGLTRREPDRAKRSMLENRGVRCAERPWARLRGTEVKISVIGESRLNRAPGGLEIEAGRGRGRPRAPPASARPSRPPPRRAQRQKHRPVLLAAANTRSANAGIGEHTPRASDFSSSNRPSSTGRSRKPRTGSHPGSIARPCRRGNCSGGLVKHQRDDRRPSRGPAQLSRASERSAITRSPYSRTRDLEWRPSVSGAAICSGIRC